MPEPTTILAAAMAVNAGFTILSGFGAREQAKLDEFNIGTERQMARASAMQATRYRDEQLSEALAASENFIRAVAGREFTPDIEAFVEREREKSGEDIANIELMSFLNQLKLNSEQAKVKRKGRETLLASVVRAVGTAAEGYEAYKDVD